MKIVVRLGHLAQPGGSDAAANLDRLRGSGAIQHGAGSRVCSGQGIADCSVFHARTVRVQAGIRNHRREPDLAADPHRYDSDGLHIASSCNRYVIRFSAMHLHPN